MEDNMLWLYYDYLIELEPMLTDLMSKVIFDSRLDNQKVALVGLENRIKSRTSFMSKCNRKDRKYERIFYVYDVIRYTIILPLDCFYNYFNIITNILIDNKLLLFRVKNTWIKFDKGIPYRGVNTLVGNMDGMIFEIQFHTYESYKTNIETHRMYEELLNCSFPSESLEIKKRMINYVNDLHIPQGIYKIHEFEYDKMILDSIMKKCATLVNVQK